MSAFVRSSAVSAGNINNKSNNKAMVSEKPVISLSDYLNEDLILEVCRFLDGYSVAKLTRISNKWAKLLANPNKANWLWEEICVRAFHPAALKKAYNRLHRIQARRGTGEDQQKRRKEGDEVELDWRLQFMKTLHVRFDGIYALKVSYLTPGERNREPNIISYFRYLRFFPKGKVLYALLNYDLKASLPWLSQFGASGLLHKKEKAAAHNNPYGFGPGAPGMLPSVNNQPGVNHGASGQIVSSTHHAAIPPPVLERIRYGKYKVANGVVTVTVDIGHMIITIRMNFSNMIQYANDRLEMISFVGHSPEEEGDGSEIPSPSPWFNFQTVTW